MLAGKGLIDLDAPIQRWWLVGEPDSLRPKRVWNDGSQPGTRTFLYVRPTQA